MSIVGSCGMEFVTESQVIHALILKGNSIVHFQRDANFNWTSNSTLSTAASLPAAICGYTTHTVRGIYPYHGSAAIIVEGQTAIAYHRIAYTNDWIRGGVIATGVIGAPCMAPISGGLVALIPLNGGLMHYEAPAFDQPWVQKDLVCNLSSGGVQATVMQSTFGGNDDNLEALVPLAGSLTHFWLDRTNTNGSWQHDVVVADSNDPACMISGTFRSNEDQPYNFEVLAKEGFNIVGYWRDNSAAGFPWASTGTVMNNAFSEASMVLGNFGANQNFEALIPEPTGVYHWWRNNSAVGFPWQRTVLVTE